MSHDTESLVVAATATISCILQVVRDIDLSVLRARFRSRCTPRVRQTGPPVLVFPARIPTTAAPAMHLPPALPCGDARQGLERARYIAINYRMNEGIAEQTQIDTVLKCSVFDIRVFANFTIKVTTNRGCRCECNIRSKKPEDAHKHFE